MGWFDNWGSGPATPSTFSVGAGGGYVGSPNLTNNIMGFGTGGAVDPSRQMTVPGAGLGGGNLGPATGLDWNLGTGQLALGGLSAIGNLWTGWNAAKLARDQFDFTKRTTEVRGIYVTPSQRSSHHTSP